MSEIKFNIINPESKSYERTAALAKRVRMAVGKAAAAERQKIFDESEGGNENENFATTVTITGILIALGDGMQVLASDLDVPLSAEEVVAFYKKIETIIHDQQRMIYHKASGRIG